MSGQQSSQMVTEKSVSDDIKTYLKSYYYTTYIVIIIHVLTISSEPSCYRITWTFPYSLHPSMVLFRTPVLHIFSSRQQNISDRTAEAHASPP